MIGKKIKLSFWSKGLRVPRIMTRGQILGRVHNLEQGWDRGQEQIIKKYLRWEWPRDF